MSSPPHTAGDAHEETSDLIESLMPIAWALVEAVHDRDPVRVAQLVNSADRLDVIAIILASQLPHATRTSASGRVVECGTREGLAEHIRRHEPSCAACRAAHVAENPAFRERAEGDRWEATRTSVLGALGRRRRPSPR